MTRDIISINNFILSIFNKKKSPVPRITLYNKTTIE